VGVSLRGGGHFSAGISRRAFLGARLAAFCSNLQHTTVIAIDAIPAAILLLGIPI
jgi:hypothetical protein